MKIMVAMLHFEGKQINDVWNVKPLGNAALNIVEVSEDDKLTITAWSDDSFVPEEDKKRSALVAGRDYIE